MAVNAELTLPELRAAINAVQSGNSRECARVLRAIVEGRTPALVAGNAVAVTIAATTGSLPTPNGSVTFANAASPTVAELLEAVVELNAKFAALAAA